MGILGHGRESIGIAVKATDVLFVLAWSSVAFTLRAIGNLRPKDGGEAVPLTVDATVTSDRVVSSGRLVIMQDGVIDSASFVGLGTGPTQRGQCFTQFFITRGGASSIYGVLCGGYVYTGSQLGFGFIEQPGPAGGHGAVRRIASADPGAGSDIAAFTIPAGAIWRPQSLSVQLVQGITQTPLPTLRIRDGTTAAVLAQVPVTPTQIGASSTAQLTWARGVSQTSFVAVVGDEFHVAPMPDLWMVSSGGNLDDIGIVTDGIGANTNYGVATLTVEEWVMPT